MTGPDGDEISVTFDLPQAEQVRASRIVHHSNKLVRAAYVACVIIIIGVLVVAGRQSSEGNPGAWSDAAPLIFLMLIWAAVLYASPWITVRQWRKNMPIHQGPHLWRISATGLAIQSPHTGSSLEWPLIRRIEETEEFLLFFLTKTYASILPKRVLPHEIIVTLRERIAVWAPPTCRLPKGWLTHTGRAA